MDWAIFSSLLSDGGNLALIALVYQLFKMDGDLRVISAILDKHLDDHKNNNIPRNHGHGSKA